MKTQKKPLTREEVRAKFISSGKTYSAWAKEHGFEHHLVRAVMSGQVKGVRGSGHEIAVKLGLKVADEI